MNIEKERIKTNLLLLDYFDMWDEFHYKSINDTKTMRYYNLITNLIDNQIDAGIRWLDSPEAEEYFKGETAYQQEVFNALEDEWDKILEGKYNSVEALLSEVYRRGKAKGYADMRSRIRYTEQDKLALQFARDYNFGLIQRLNDDTIHQIKNTIISGFLSGDHPNIIAPKILNVAEERLDESTFSPKQRATMIARTEVSRVQNTGILQSYVNEGYTEVKILTAEDNNVCTTCLKYAFHFNDDEITYENRGKEKVHNIIKLIKNGNFPPFHPLCRCTYLSVWKSKREHPENPHVINLTPLKFLDQNGEILLPDGKPKIKWTKDSLRARLSNFADSQKELDLLVDGIMDYMENLENRNIEFLSAMGNDFKMYCTQHDINSHKGVDLCPKGIKEAKNKGLFFVIHNHPSNNPLQSESDIKAFAHYGVKYNIVFTERRGLLILKNNSKDELTIKDTWNKIFDKMKNRFIEKDYESYKKEEKMWISKVNSRDKFKRNIKTKVKDYMSENIEESLGVYYECMVSSGIGITLISP